MKQITKDIIAALKRTIEEAENSGHRNILFPVPDAKALVADIEKIEEYPDTEADGYVFCGKCGKMT